MSKSFSKLVIASAIACFLGIGINNAFAATAPIITTQPVNVTVIAPSAATFTVVASGASLTYQWEEYQYAVGFVPISGATSASYTTPATTVAADNGNEYVCVVSNASGSVTSNIASLTVNMSVSITSQPANATVIAPSAATFKVVASGPSLTYQWEEYQYAVGFVPISGATSASYTTPATTVAADNGNEYVCVVSNASGSVTSNIASLTVNMSVSITSQPANATVIAPSAATFKVVASGPSLTYQWEEYQYAVGFVPISGATSASYTTPATTVAADNGNEYVCVVSNASGSVTSNIASLTVNMSVSITTQPVNTTVIAPSAATFKVVASGPSLTYQWEEYQYAVGFVPISGATSASYTTPATTVAADNGNEYVCVVSNASGSVTSNIASLTVNMSVSITTQPANVTVIAPAKATFTVVGSGPSLTYQWEKYIINIGFEPITGATSASYTTPATTASDDQSYYECVVSNPSGSVVSSQATLTVYTLPTITTQPTSATVTAPITATFTVAASGLSLTYQWKQEASGASSYTAISGATGTSYTTPPTTVANNGTRYECVVSNLSGSVTSNAATITVNPEPLPTVTIVNPVNHGSFTSGSINITAITGESVGGISSVAFYNGTTLLGKVTSNSPAFTYKWTNVPTGTYTIKAIATDSTGGTTTSSTITFTVNTAPFSIAVDNNLATKTDALDHTTSLQYDNDNRLLKIIYADGSTVSSAYDLFGNQISVTDQRGNKLTKTYDAYERLSQTKDPLSGTTQFAYDTNGDLLTLTDANGHATTYTYDADYRVLTQKNALNFTTTYAYDPAGNVATRTDANGKATNYTYDALNRLTNIAYPDGTSVVNALDALGRRSSMTDSTGQTTYTYDAVSQLLTKTAPGTNNTITYTYDSEGNELTSRDQNNRTITNTYDALDRLASVADPNGTTSYGYDAVSNELLVRTPNGVMESFTYDALNRLLTDVNSTSSLVISSFTNVYDVAGMITKKSLSDGSWTAYTYDALNRLLSETKQTSTSTIYNYVYTYDHVGSRLTWTKNTTLGGFWSVDSLNMPSQVLTNMTTAGYGNTASPTQALSLVRTYTNDAGNRLTSWAYAANINTSSFPVQTDTYTYDKNGNRLTKQAVLTGLTGTPQQTSYTFDFENRLNKLTYTNIPKITGTQTDSLIYNGEGLRIQATSNSVPTNYLYDGFNVLVERNGSGTTTKSYTRGLDFGGGIGSLIAQNTGTTSSTAQYYQYNDLGSTSNLTTSTGTTAQSYNYDAFGNLLASQAVGDTNRYLFSTKEFDSRSGLDYFGRRYYDPEVGRWLTPDPLGMVNGPDGYAYCGNNPINCVDPLGLYWGEDQVNWWLYQSVVPGPYGQPVSEWGPNGPTGWGDPIGESDKFCAGGLERAVVGIAGGATAIASGGILLDSDPLIGWKGGEITFTNPGSATPDFRINPFGDWDSDNPYARLPHYHSRPGIGNHRPWEGGF